MISVFHTPREVLGFSGIRWNQYFPSESGLYMLVKSRDPSARVGKLMGPVGGFAELACGFDIFFNIYEYIKNLFNF
jgi:hypothetical protein